MTEASKWQPRIGEQVVITSSKSWASDWVDAAGQPLVLWVAGMTALTDGIDVTLSEEWPLPTRLFGQGHLTDGFIIARSGDQDDIAPLSPPTNGEVSEPIDATLPSEQRVQRAAGILEEWDMKDPPDATCGWPYEMIARDLLTRDAATPRAAPTDGEMESMIDRGELVEDAKGGWSPPDNEVERLTKALHRANANCERFEREWYLRGDKVEELEAKLAAMTSRAAPTDAVEAVALRDIAGERQRQIGEEGWTVEHDDAHDSSDLALAAICYADPSPDTYAGLGGGTPKRWPWASKWWKPSERRRNLVKAAALLVAEIERLDRALAAMPAPEPTHRASSDEVERAVVDVKLALANWKKYSCESDEIAYHEANKVAEAATSLIAAMSPSQSDNGEG